MSHTVSPLVRRIARDRRLTSRDMQVWIWVAADNLRLAAESAALIAQEAL